VDVWLQGIGIFRRKTCAGLAVTGADAAATDL
jgi:hypothetical protein